MNGQTPPEHRSQSCRFVADDLQDYLDGELPKEESLKIFLHLRECASCQQLQEEAKRVFSLLAGGGQLPVPEGFNARILKSVPYEAYQAMAPLRRDRAAVYLREDYLPASVRSPVTRAAGVVLAAAAGTGLLLSWLPAAASIAVVVGVLPELVVRLQQCGRKLVPSNHQRSPGA